MKVLVQGFRIPNNPSEFTGLKETSVSRLPEIAIFAGPNGGGKSRLLRLISTHGPNQGKRAALLRELQTFQDARVKQETVAQQNLAQTNPMHQNLGSAARHIATQLTNQISSAEKEISKILSIQ